MGGGRKGTRYVISVGAGLAAGWDRTQCIVLTAICVGCKVGGDFCDVSQKQTNWPGVAQRWVKWLEPHLYRKKMSHQEN